MFRPRNGDTILRANSYDMSSPEQALAFYGSPRKATRVTVRLLRRGRPLELHYRRLP